MCNAQPSDPGALSKASGFSFAAPVSFAAPGDKATLEEGLVLMPKFDANGLVTVVATDAASGDVLMVAHMNADALTRTLSTGNVWYWSRSRQALWRKGETSGHTQTLVEMRVDCDQDALLLKVRQEGPACHTNRRSCFYRTVGESGSLILSE